MSAAVSRWNSLAVLVILVANTGAIAEDYRNQRGEPQTSPMVLVPAGVFQMGDPWNEGDTDEHPVHEVFVSAFRIDKYEITNAFYAEFLNAGGNDTHWNELQRIERSGEPGAYSYTPDPGFEDHPAMAMTWFAAVAFCDWRSERGGLPGGFHRLPTEAEWEKTASWDPRGSGRHYRYGFQQDTISCDWANYTCCWCDTTGTTQVGHFNARSYYGCYEMSGNVQEWCADWYSSTYYTVSPSSDPTGPGSGTHRVLRGGGLYSSAYNCRTAQRGFDSPNGGDDDTGFRCVARAFSDCNSNGIPDQSEPDCDTDGTPDSCEIAAGSGVDCNTNGTPDDCEITGGTPDCNANGTPDECEADSTPTACQILLPVSRKLHTGVERDIKIIPTGDACGDATSEPRQGGITELRIGFTEPPGGPGPCPVTISELRCPACPCNDCPWSPYVGTSVMAAVVEGNDLVLQFAPGLENARTYKFDIGPSVTTIPGQSFVIRVLQGDVTDDGRVDATDRSVVVGVWTGSGFSTKTDLNLDGVTNSIDRSIVVGVWTGAENCAP